MQKNNQVGIIKKELSPIVEKAKGIKIINEKDLLEATEMLSQVNKIKDKITLEKEKVVVPLNEALKAERARWKPAEDVYKEAIEVLREKMSKYQTEVVLLSRKEEAKIANRVGEGKGKLKLETAVKKISELDTVLDEVIADSGSVKFREDKVLKITDESKIPDKYFVLDEKALLADLKAGIEVAGATLEVKMIPLNYR